MSREEVVARQQQQQTALEAETALPRETAAVKKKRQEHLTEFERIAREHARIAAEQSRLSSLARQFGEIYD